MSRDITVVLKDLKGDTFVTLMSLDTVIYCINTFKTGGIVTTTNGVDAVSMSIGHRRIDPTEYAEGRVKIIHEGIK